MKKTILKLILLLFLCNGSIQAEIINIINDNKNVQIQINGQNVGQGSIYNKEITSGSHQVKVILNNKVIYSKIVNS